MFYGFGQRGRIRGWRSGRLVFGRPGSAGGFELQLEWVVNPASVFVEAAALVEGACEEDEEDHAGSLHGGYGVEGGREAESLGDHAAKQYTDPHAEIP